MKPILLVAALACSACLQPAEQLCGGQLCPAGTCVDGSICATPEQLAACADIAEAQPCSFFSDPGTCFHGVCEPLVCGDGKAFLPELCDDGNSVSGDHCSGDCRSLEACGNMYLDVGEQCDDGNLRSRDGCTSKCEVESLTWVNVTPAVPGLVAGMTFDSTRRRAVAFGGGSSNHPRADTWEFAGNRWELVQPLSAPDARIRTAFAFDAKRNVAVLVGGTAETDTWTYDGSTWHREHPETSPAASGMGLLAYDPDHEVMLFVGIDIVQVPLTGTQFEEFVAWTWDGAAWTMAPAPPEIPSNFGDGVFLQLVHDDQTHSMLLVSATSAMKWDGTAWSSVSLSGAASDQSAPSIVEVNDRVLMFGDYDSSMPGMPVYALDVANRRWSQIGRTSADSVRTGALTTYDSARNEVVFVGGNAPSVSDAPPLSIALTDLHARSFAVVAPPPATAHLVQEPSSGRLVAYDETARETWEWDGRWTKFMVGGPADVVAFAATRTGALALTSDSQSWLWTDHTWTRATPERSPRPRLNSQAAWDPARGLVVLFGGLEPGVGSEGVISQLGDTWEWNGTTWTERTAAGGPGGRSGAALAFEPRSGRIFLYGGDTSTSTSEGRLANDVWSWDGTTWQSEPSRDGPPRSNAHLFFDAAIGHLVLFGGSAEPFAGSARDDLWLYDGATWSQRLASGSPPEPSSYGTAAYDAVRAQLLVLGTTGDIAAATRLVAARFDRPQRDPDRCESIDSDADGLVGCLDPDCAPLCTPECPQGGVCPYGPQCGDTTCDPLEDHELCPADCP